MKKAVVLINQLSDHPSEDEWDVLDQACEIEIALDNLGYKSERVFLNLNLASVRELIDYHKPGVVFNLVESVDGKGDLIYLAPAILNHLHIPYTGCPLESMFITSNKMMAQKMMRGANIPTPRAYSYDELDELDTEKYYIAKPLWEDASVGIDDHSVFCGDQSSILDDFKRCWNRSFFVEEYVEGREFSLSLLGGLKGPVVLPPAEIRFMDFPDDKPHIVGYAAKWDHESFEYHNTCRSFDFPDQDLPLLVKMETLAYEIWDLFKLRGYARVDFRVDKYGKPYVLEVNANPCLSADAGFQAACQRMNISFTEVVGRILEDTM